MLTRDCMLSYSTLRAHHARATCGLERPVWPSLVVLVLAPRNTLLTAPVYTVMLAVPARAPAAVIAAAEQESEAT